MTGLHDLDGYLDRIGLRGRPEWTAVHRAHATSIPFENLDPATGTPVSLDPGRLEDKLVARHRGGYCFEHNLLLKAALESFGARQVTPMLARVRQGGSGPRPRSHLVLRVVADGAPWHADVGFGSDTLLDPIPFGPGPPVEQSGWRYRVVEDGAELVLQIWRDDDWGSNSTGRPGASRAHRHRRRQLVYLHQPALTIRPRGLRRQPTPRHPLDLDGRQAGTPHRAHAADPHRPSGTTRRCPRHPGVTVRPSRRAHPSLAGLTKPSRTANASCFHPENLSLDRPRRVQGPAARRSCGSRRCRRSLEDVVIVVFLGAREPGGTLVTIRRRARVSQGTERPVRRCC